MSDPRVRLAPGHVYYRRLRCDYCDYVLEVDHSGPDYDRGVWKLKECPNCKVHGIRSFLKRSNK